VRTAAHRHEQIVVSGETNSSQDVSYATAADDQRRLFVDHLIEDAARLLILGATRQDWRAGEVLREVVNRTTVDLRFLSRQRCSSECSH
jgi:hypothetical protein